jgi:hypothetical protein
MKAVDLSVAAFFLVVGGYLAASAQSLPPGLGHLPGPGAFPLMTGVLMAALAALLGIQALRRTGGVFRMDHAATTAGVVALTFAYLLLWGHGGFALRTALFLAVLLRLLGEHWRRALLVSAALTAAVTLAFQFGLRLTLE